MTNDEIRDVIERDGGVPILSDDEPETLLGVMPIPEISVDESSAD